MVVKENNCVIVECDCGCDEGMIFRFGLERCENDDWIICYLSCISGDFYTDQTRWYHKLGHRIKLAWLMLTGKEYRFKELCLNRDGINKMCEAINEFRN